MTYKEKYESLVDRIHLPENLERHKKCLNNPSTTNEELLILHFNHCRDYLDKLKIEDDNELIKNSLAAALRAIETILDEDKWE